MHVPLWDSYLNQNRRYALNMITMMVMVMMVMVMVMFVKNYLRNECNFWKVHGSQSKHANFRGIFSLC